MLRPPPTAGGSRSRAQAARRTTEPRRTRDVALAPCLPPLLALLALLFLIGAARSLSAPAPQRADVAGARYRLDAASAKRSGARLLSGHVRRATFSFDPAMAPADRQAFLAAVASARPEPVA